MQSVIAVACKVIRIFYAILTKGVTYDGAKMLQDIKRPQMEGFFLGESILVNEKLSEIFLQLHIGEKSGRGVPKILETYGKEAFTFRENSIVVTIPFKRIRKVENKVENKKGLNARRQKILVEMRDNPNITASELHVILGVSETAVWNNLNYSNFAHKY